MGNVYSAKHSNGKTYDVETDQHHADHTEQSFKDHLLTAIMGSIGGLASGYILHFTLKGRR